MRIAVTGASGYLGQLLVERLVRERIPDELVGVDIAPSSLPASQLRYRRRDVRDPDIARDLAGADVVVHLAFVVETLRDRKLMYDVNLGGSRNVLRACEQARVPALVVASSVAAYGVQHDRVITESTPLLGDSRSFYAHTKRLVEEEIDTFEERNPATRVVRMRPSIILGPRCNTWALPAMSAVGLLDTPRGMRLPIIHEDDVVEAFVLAITRPVSGPMLVAHRESPRVRDLARMIGKRPARIPAGILLRLADRAFELGLTRMSSDWLLLSTENEFRFDPTATERRLGWKPRYAPEDAFAAVMANVDRLPASARLAPAITDRLEGTRYSLHAP